VLLDGTVVWFRDGETATESPWVYVLPRERARGLAVIDLMAPMVQREAAARRIRNPDPPPPRRPTEPTVATATQWAPQTPPRVVEEIRADLRECERRAGCDCAPAVSEEWLPRDVVTRHLRVHTRECRMPLELFQRIAKGA